jgi:hypothetical protein
MHLPVLHSSKENYGQRNQAQMLKHILYISDLSETVEMALFQTAYDI